MTKKYLKVMFGKNSGANSFKYKINEINIAETWDPTKKNPKEMGGFNFSVEDKIIRWLVRGDTIYDVKIPENTEVIEVSHPSTPHGVFRSNKIILTNPRKVTDEMALYYYKKSNIPEKSYYKAMAGCAIRGYKKTALQIMKDKVTKDNINLVLKEFYDFIYPKDNTNTNGNIKTVKTIEQELLKIKNNQEKS